MGCQHNPYNPYNFQTHHYETLTQSEQCILNQYFPIQGHLHVLNQGCKIWGGFPSHLTFKFSLAEIYHAILIFHLFSNKFIIFG